MSKSVPYMKARKKVRVRTKAVTTEVRYNSSRKSKSHLADNFDWFMRALAPLKAGKTVTLVMDDKSPVHMKARFVAPDRKRAVVIAPYAYPGLGGGYLVSVLGKGSCIVQPSKQTQSANLVLAGMPARLANALLEKLRELER